MLPRDSWLERGGWALGQEGCLPSAAISWLTEGLESPQLPSQTKLGHSFPKSLVRSYPQLEQNAHEVCPAVCAFSTGLIFMDADYQTDLPPQPSAKA